jgi:glycosyltransferase involved in cell wall biosynthesis
VEDVAPLLGALDVFVSASHVESFGLAIVEAMASGLAVLATATEGARELIEDEATGLLVPIGDVGALSKSLLRLLEDAGERARLGARARDAARRHYGLEQMIEATENLYLDVVREREGSRG